MGHNKTKVNGFFLVRYPNGRHKKTPKTLFYMALEVLFVSLRIFHSNKLVELAGIEPASRKRQPLVLHA
jgi:hypothetical protein